MLISDRLKGIARRFGFTRNNLFSKSQRRQHTALRAIVVKELAAAGYSVLKMADVLKLDHSSVLNLLDGFQVRPENLSLVKNKREAARYLGIEDEFLIWEASNPQAEKKEIVVYADYETEQEGALLSCKKVKR